MIVSGNDFEKVMSSSPKLLPDLGYCAAFPYC